MRLAAGLKVSALVRAVGAAGGFATVLARGDEQSGSIAVVSRSKGIESVLAPVMAGAGGYQWAEAATGEAVSGWIARARGRDPDLWVVEIDGENMLPIVELTLAQD